MALPIVCCVWPTHQTSVLGRFSARVLATWRQVASSTPEASNTLSGVHLAMTSSRTLSMAQTRSSMYFLSSQPLLKT